MPAGSKSSLTGTLAADEATDHPMDGPELGELTVLGVGAIQIVCRLDRLQTT